MKAREGVYQHFRVDERPFIERVGDWIDIVTMRHQPYLTDFLNPRERYILSTLAQQATDVTFSFDGGYDHAEYARCLLAPNYWHPQSDEFSLAFLRITGASQFQSLEHRDYLGAIMNLGIKRDKIGDLIVDGDICQLVTTDEMATFVRLNLHHVHRVRVSVEEIKREQLVINEKALREQMVTVASPRLDAVLSAVFPLSRSKVVPLIQSGKCKLNWKVEENPAVLVGMDDTLSLRGYGRVHVLAVEGLTKRGRIRLTVGKPI